MPIFRKLAFLKSLPLNSLVVDLTGYSWNAYVSKDSGIAQECGFNAAASAARQTILIATASL